MSHFSQRDHSSVYKVEERTSSIKPHVTELDRKSLADFNSVITMQQTCLDPDTGERVMGDSIAYLARVNRKEKFIADDKGQMSLSNYKIYLAPSAEISFKSKIQIGEVSYTIKQIEEKRHFNNSISHYVVYC